MKIVQRGKNICLSSTCCGFGEIGMYVHVSVRGAREYGRGWHMAHSPKFIPVILVPGKKRQDKCLVYRTRHYLKIIRVRDVAYW